MKQDILIIGAGIIGLATAERLLTLGANVTILEQKEAGRESSWAGGGILSPLYPWNYSDEVTQLAHYSAGLYPAWIDALQKTSNIDPEYEKSGLLILPPHETETAQQWCLMRGIKIERMAVSNVLSNENRDDHALLLPDVAQVRNPRLIQALISRVMQLGGRIIENCAVYHLKAGDRVIQSVDTSCGEFRADYHIISAGAWSRKILGSLAIRLDIRPIQGQMLLFKFDEPPLQHITVQRDLYIIPRKDGHVLIGSTLEDKGFDKQTTKAAFSHLLQNALAILPSLEKMPLKQHWSGLRPASSRNIPTIGRHPHIRNLLINSGHFRYGVTMAPGSAELLVNELTGATQPFDIAPYCKGWHGG